MAQKSVLSPLLFNVFLDAALRSSKLLEQALKRGDLIAYADDLTILTSSTVQAETIIKELEKLEYEWCLKINKRKTEFISNTTQSPETISGILKV